MGQRVLLLLVLALLTAMCLSAQSDRGTITGRVSDPSGAVVPGAEVTAKNVETGVISRTTSNDLGLYTVLNLPIGTYSVEFRAQGFKSFTQEHVTISIAQVVRIDANLTLGSRPRRSASKPTLPR